MACRSSQGLIFLGSGFMRFGHRLLRRTLVLLNREWSIVNQYKIISVE